MNYQVVSPVGEVATESVSGSTGLDGLEGKTICEIWNGEFRGDESFPMIREIIRKRYPKAKLVPYNELPLSEIQTWQGVRKEETARLWRAKLKEKGCDAVIIGNGG